MSDKKTNNERLAVLETDMSFVKKQVSNHIPTSLGELDKRVRRLEIEIAIATGGLAVVMFLIDKFF